MCQIKKRPFKAQRYFHYREELERFCETYFTSRQATEKVKMLPLESFFIKKFQ